MKTKSANTLPKILPGAVCVQMVRCGKPQCKCTGGQLHGPYFYHFKRVNGVLVKRYIKKKDAAEIRAACEAYREAESQRRQMQKVNIRKLLKAIEQLRENEKLLSQFLEMNHG